jgi:hypothetical protein
LRPLLVGKVNTPKVPDGVLIFSTFGEFLLTAPAFAIKIAGEAGRRETLSCSIVELLSFAVSGFMWFLGQVSTTSQA